MNEKTIKCANNSVGNFCGENLFLNYQNNNMNDGTIIVINCIRYCESSISHKI